MKYFKLIVLIILIFALGYKTGVYSSRQQVKQRIQYLSHREIDFTRFFKKFIKDIDLSDEQEELIKNKLKEKGKLWNQQRLEMQISLTEQYEELFAEIAKELNDKQREKLLEKQKKFFKKKSNLRKY